VFAPPTIGDVVERTGLVGEVVEQPRGFDADGIDPLGTVEYVHGTKPSSFEAPRPCASAAIVAG
jgi:hypothetical protein